ncbi:hypothetical protein WI89_13775 [Burkholderia ubonensis]|uniref:hypothetical protein n=1 Tax=Burkholderia ubonensis TaxID=101571 RepID=UPI00075D1AF9|nr:hypothetical protein [Burkholderia ubonensis]KVD72789.1 hypothetical protein WI89_13775 [Burkholderia ubonensis]KVD91476.1 hypothetical protein WI90_13695 [Burkholderia ubonensis]KVU49126.1 hypothetical protein WK68_04185 [Burkholderia ubonensis]KVU79354.1 hypothetical protein WK73_05750 [Burkholderia ubonensis]
MGIDSTTHQQEDSTIDFQPYDDSAKLTQQLARIDAANQAAIQAAADKAYAARTETYRRDIQRRVQRMVDDFVKTEAARIGIAELKASRVLVMLKKPREYYNSFVEAVSLMQADGYLLDRQVKDLKPFVLAEASKRAGCAPALSDSCWYSEFSPAVQKRVNALLAGMKLTTVPVSLAKVRDALRAHHSGHSEVIGPTGITMNGKRFQFNGDGTMIWAGDERKITTKVGSRYVRIGPDSVNIDKTLQALGITPDELAQWEANAAIVYARRRANEAYHDETEHHCGTRYD